MQLAEHLVGEGKYDRSRFGGTVSCSVRFWASWPHSGDRVRSMLVSSVLNERSLSILG